MKIIRADLTPEETKRILAIPGETVATFVRQAALEKLRKIEISKKMK